MHPQTFLQTFPTELGWCGFVYTENGLQLLDFGFPTQKKLLDSLKVKINTGKKNSVKWSTQAALAPTQKIGNDARKLICAYLSGEKKVSLRKIKLDLSLSSPFSKKVYQALVKVEAGKVVTYQGLAKKIKSPKASRAVGTAMRTNRLPLIIPCHRVIKSDLTLGQYSACGGTKTKKLLLEMEGIFLN